MPIGRYVTYKCKKCGYKVVKFQGDVLVSLGNICPKCGNEMQIINESIYPSTLENILKIFKKLRRKDE